MEIERNPGNEYPTQKEKYHENTLYGQILVESGLMDFFKTGNLMSFEERAEFGDRVQKLLNKYASEEKHGLLVDFLSRTVRKLKQMPSDTEGISDQQISEILKIFFTELDADDFEQIDCKHSPLGAVIFEVKTVSLWEKMGFDENERGSHLTHNLLDRVALSSPSIKQQAFNRFVFINSAFSNSDSFVKHELFHDFLYNALTVPDAYKNKVEQWFFNRIKDEILAYIVEGRWEYDPDLLLPINFLEEYEEVNKKKDIAFKDFFKARLRNSEYVHFDKPDEQEIINQVESYVKNLKNTLGQLERLDNIKSKEYKQAFIDLLASQTFAEMAYKLSKI